MWGIVGRECIGRQNRGADVRLDACEARFHDGYPHVVWTEKERTLGRGAGSLGYGRFLLEAHILPAELDRRAVEVIHDKGNVVDRALHSAARNAFGVLGDEEPDITEAQSVQLVLQAGRGATHDVAIPGQGFVGVDGAEVYLVKTEDIRILHEFNTRAPGIEDIGLFEEARHVAPGRAIIVPLETDSRASDADRFELSHTCGQIRHRESDVVDAGSLAAARGGLGHEDDLDSIAIRGVVAVGKGFAAHVPGIPVDSLQGTRRGDMDAMVIGRGDEAGRSQRA